MSTQLARLTILAAVSALALGAAASQGPAILPVAPAPAKVSGPAQVPVAPPAAAQTPSPAKASSPVQIPAAPPATAKAPGPVPAASAPVTAPASAAQAAEPPPAADPVLAVGISGYQGIDPAKAQAAALAAWVHKVLDRAVDPRAFRTYFGVANALATGEVDLAILTPAVYLRAKKQGTIQPLAKVERFGRSSYRSVLIAGPATSWSSVEELAKASGLKAGWVDRSSAAGYLVPRDLLRAAGADFGKLFASERFFGSHDKLCKALLEGRIDVAASYSNDPGPGPSREVSGCVPSLGMEAAKLKIVATSGPISTEVVAVRPGFAPAEVEKLRAALLGLKGSGEGKKTLREVFDCEALVPFNEEGYAALELAMSRDEARPSAQR